MEECCEAEVPGRLLARCLAPHKDWGNGGAHVAGLVVVEAVMTVRGWGRGAQVLTVLAAMVSEAGAELAVLVGGGWGCWWWRERF